MSDLNLANVIKPITTSFINNGVHPEISGSIIPDDISITDVGNPDSLSISQKRQQYKITNKQSAIIKSIPNEYYHSLMDGIFNAELFPSTGLSNEIVSTFGMDSKEFHLSVANFRGWTYNPKEWILDSKRFNGIQLVPAIIIKHINGDASSSTTSGCLIYYTNGRIGNVDDLSKSIIMKNVSIATNNNIIPMILFSCSETWNIEGWQKTTVDEVTISMDFRDTSLQTIVDNSARSSFFQDIREWLLKYADQQIDITNPDIFVDSQIQFEFDSAVLQLMKKHS